MTVRGIAKEAGVSIATVSRILNGDYSRVSSDTLDRVQGVIKKHNYVLKKKAPRKRSERFILVVPSVNHMFFSEVVKAAGKYALAKGHEMILYSIDNSFETRDLIISRIAASDVEWILYMGISQEDQESLLPLLSADKKIVFLDNIAYQNGISASVIADGEDAMFQLTNHYISKGHRQIAYITGTKEARFNNERHKGYTRALLSHNLVVDPELTRFGDFSFSEGYECAKSLLSFSQEFSAIICENDMMALGAMKAIHEHGLKIPHDISLSGFDDTYLADKVDPPLTTIRQPLDTIIEESFSLLGRMSSGDKMHNYIVKIPCQIIERKSIASVED